MNAEFSPGLTLVLGGLLLPLLPQWLRSGYAIALPLLGLVQLALLGSGSPATVDYLGLELVLLRVDRWSLLFGAIFMLAAAVSGIYAWHVRSAAQQAAALVYAGAAVGAVFAGDLVTLFVFWELTAVSSVLLVWARGTPASYRAGMRYFVIQLLSGLLLLFGAIAHHQATGSLRFDHIGLSGTAGWLIFIAFGIKCAFPLLHGWLRDAYPEATETGTVFLSVFTTKLAVYALARGFAGTEILVPIGATMAVVLIVYALIEDDLRRSLAYGLNSQLGFMVVGVGIGTELSLNGAAAHAVVSVLYMALLFMAMGAVLYRVGTARCSELGGLVRSMPATAALCIVGAASIAGVPLLSGFVSKSMIVSAAGSGGHLVAWAAMLVASVAVFLLAGLRICGQAFFGRDSGARCAEAPPHMLLAMGIAAALGIGVGVYPAPLYGMLPFQVVYAPFTASHLIAQLQLLVFAALATALLWRIGFDLRTTRSTTIDVDWLYRRPGPALARSLVDATGHARRAWDRAALASIDHAVALVRRHHDPASRLAQTWSTRAMALWVLVLLLGYLLLYFV